MVGVSRQGCTYTIVVSTGVSAYTCREEGASPPATLAEAAGTQAVCIQTRHIYRRSVSGYMHGHGCGNTYRDRRTEAIQTPCRYLDPCEYVLGNERDQPSPAPRQAGVFPQSNTLAGQRPSPSGPGAGRVCANAVPPPGAEASRSPSSPRQSAAPEDTFLPPRPLRTHRGRAKPSEMPSKRRKGRVRVRCFCLLTCAPTVRTSARTAQRDQHHCSSWSLSARSRLFTPNYCARVTL